MNLRNQEKFSRPGKNRNFRVEPSFPGLLFGISGPNKKISGLSNKNFRADNCTHFLNMISKRIAALFEILYENKFLGQNIRHEIETIYPCFLFLFLLTNIIF